MAVPKTLTTQIQDLINSIGDLDRPAIKAKLVRFLRLAEALESGATTRKAKAKVARLETALEASKSNYAAAYLALENSCSDIKNLQSELQTMQAEIAKYQAERTNENHREGDLPPEQLDILRRLPSEHGGLGLTVLQIWQEVSGRLDEAEIHVSKLEKAGLIYWHMEADGDKFWRRTMQGNELVVAKRLAGEETTESEKRAETGSERLSAIEEKILLFLIPISSRRHDYGWGTSVSEIAEHINTGRKLTEDLLDKMRAAQLIKQMPVPENIIGGTPGWARTDAGDVYLAKHGLLK